MVSISGLDIFERITEKIPFIGNKSDKNIVDSLMEFIIKKPYVTMGIIAIITLFLAVPSSQMGDSISSNVDQYLPEDTEATKNINIVRENWATKMVIIYIETGNAKEPYNNETGTGCPDNITDRDILMEISAVEGDEFNEGINYARGDGGKQDEVAYVLSITALIKEINVSALRMANVLEEELAIELEEIFGFKVNVTGDDGVMEEGGHYSIPGNQTQIDQIIDQIPDNVLSSFLCDTNNDGIWDATFIMLGCLEETDDKTMMDFVNKIIEQRPKGGDDAYFDENGNRYHTEMMQTGICAIMVEITDECFKQLIRTMPLAIFFVVAIMLFFHRTPKILLIAGIPLLFSIIWTFGLITLTGIELSPIIVAAMPMLIGLSVDYSLHFANRIAEFKEEGETIEQGIKDALHTTGKAIFLSAATTIIGFAALFIAILKPIRVVGLTLVLGITSSFILTMCVVPALVLILKYRKRELAAWKKIAEIPDRFAWQIIVTVIILTLISIIVFLPTMMETPKEKEKRGETNLESIKAIWKFSDNWAKGQSALIIIKGTEEVYPEGGALNDTEFLDGIEFYERDFLNVDENISGIDEVTAMTIVDMFKSVALNISYTTVSSKFEDEKNMLPDPLKQFVKQADEIIGEETSTVYWTYSYWEFIHILPNEDSKRRAIRIFYDSLTDEAMDMLMTEDYSMTLCMIYFPYEGPGLTQAVVDELDEIVDKSRTDNNWKDENGKKMGWMSHTTGWAALGGDIRDAIMDSQKFSIIFSLIFVFIILTIIFKSMRIAFLTMIPVFIVVSWQPMTMKGVSGMASGASLNMLTAMIGSIVIGAGIDFGVHISQRIKEEGETIPGVKRAVQHTGQSILEANLTTVVGLSGGLIVLWFRGFFTVLLALLLYSMFAGMIVLPAVYSILIRRKNKIDEEYEYYYGEDEENYFETDDYE